MKTYLMAKIKNTVFKIQKQKSVNKHIAKMVRDEVVISKCWCIEWTAEKLANERSI